MSVEDVEDVEDVSVEACRRWYRQTGDDVFNDVVGDVNDGLTRRINGRITISTDMVGCD